jgi:hypothetical protein
MLTAIVISPRPKVTQRAITWRVDNVSVANTGKGRAKTVNQRSALKRPCSTGIVIILKMSDDRFRAKFVLNSL